MFKTVEEEPLYCLRLWGRSQTLSLEGTVVEAWGSQRPRTHTRLEGIYMFHFVGYLLCCCLICFPLLVLSITLSAHCSVSTTKPRPTETLTNELSYVSFYCETYTGLVLWVQWFPTEYKMSNKVMLQVYNVDHVFILCAKLFFVIMWLT